VIVFLSNVKNERRVGHVKIVQEFMGCDDDARDEEVEVLYEVEEPYEFVNIAPHKEAERRGIWPVPVYFLAEDDEPTFGAHDTGHIALPPGFFVDERIVHSHVARAGREDLTKPHPVRIQECDELLQQLLPPNVELDDGLDHIRFEFVNCIEEGVFDVLDECDDIGHRWARSACLRIRSAYIRFAREAT